MVLLCSPDNRATISRITYEVLDKQPGESSSRLRVVPASELYADILAEEAPRPMATRRDNISATDGVEYSWSMRTAEAIVAARSNVETIDEKLPARP